VLIEDYAFIGDCNTGALVSKAGSIDWLCLPHFDSGACFAALLGKPQHGYWAIHPAGKVHKVHRRYQGSTLILETEFSTTSGTAVVIDFMVRPSDSPVLARRVVCTRGEIRMRMELVIRFDYGSIVPWVERTNEGIMATAGPDMVGFRTKVGLENRDFKTTAEFTLKAGQEASFDLTWYPSNRYAPRRLDVKKAESRTRLWWEKWANSCCYQGPWREAVVRSLLTLKALTFEPTGAIVAAPTTSLPENIGGVRNWDYRFCWVRDSTLTLNALLKAGYVKEAKNWREWLLRAVAGHPSELNIMYGIRGERRLTEVELPWLPGYESSSPVRVGNAAYAQFQLDIFGEVIDTLYQCRKEGIHPGKRQRGVGRALMGYLETAWEKPDEGIWEVRGPRRHFTHSKVMAWVALDRAVKAMGNGWLPYNESWVGLRDRIHAQVCEKGFDTRQNSFVQFYGSDHLDASLLMIPLVGFLPAKDPRVLGTVKAIERKLMSKDGFVGRYTSGQHVDGLPEGEGAFLPCTLWMADNYVLQGRRAEAKRVLRQVLAIRNDVGLLSEEYDTQAKRMAGNFPQAFSHVGLVNTALRLNPSTAKMAAPTK
jgi:GH15 family glucan-1,4-alpha-glucosidase